MMSRIDSTPISMCRFTKSRVTCWSLSSVLMPSGTIGWSDTSSRAPTGMRLARPVVNRVAVSMSIAIARVLRKYALNDSSCSQMRRLVV